MSTKKKPENYELTIYPKNQDITKSWYVELTYTDPVTFETCRKQYRGGINYQKSIGARLKDAKDLIAALKLKLSTGWNPITNSILTKDLGTSMADMPLNEALDFALESKQTTLAKKSLSDIRGVKDFAKVASIKLRLHLTPVSTIKRNHVKLLLEQIAKDRQATYVQEHEAKVQMHLLKGKSHEQALRMAGTLKTWTGNSYNKYRQYLQILFSELEEYDAVEINPCLRIGSKPQIKTNIYRHATEKEEKLIKETLRKKKPELLTYLAFEYLTGIRPKELFGLQVTDIDWFNQCIEIQATDEKSKTRSARRVPIPNSLLPYIEGLKLQYAHPDDHIFSTNFVPGPKRKKRDYATKWWKRLIIDELGINVKMYSFKGKGGDDKRKAGIDAGAVSSQYGHASMNMTKVYLHGEQDRINKEIREKTPGF